MIRRKENGESVKNTNTSVTRSGRRLRVAMAALLAACMLVTAPRQVAYATSGGSTESSENPSTPKQSMPTVEISRADMNSVKGGESFSVPVTIKNRGTTALIKPVLTISASGALHLAEKSSTVFLTDIAAGATYNLNLKFTADETLSASSEEFGVSIKYNYDDGTGVTDVGEESVSVTVPTTITKVSEVVPVIQISRGKLSSVKADKSFTLPVTVYNAGDAEIKNAVLSVVPEEGLSVTDKSTSYVIGGIAAKEKKTIKLGMKTAKSLSVSVLNVDCDLKYTYTSAGTSQSGAETAKITVPVVSNTTASQTSIPLIQITKSEIKNPVKADQKFSVHVTIKNAGDSDITNAALTVDGSDELLIVDNTSSFSIKKLAAGEDMARMSFQLATIVTDVPLDFTPEQAVWDKNYRPELYPLFVKLGFRKLIDKWGLRPGGKTESHGRPDSAAPADSPTVPSSSMP